MVDYLLLPSELLIDILNRLPLETLLRCTSVCKTWYSFITSPSFITTHLLNNNNNGSYLIVTPSNNHPRKINYYVYHDNESFDECVQLEFPIALSHSKFKIFGSINGLVLGLYGVLMFLWNPSTRKHLIVPNPDITFNSHGCHRDCIGFGFDPLNNDYKIVRVVYLIKKSGCVVPPEVEVYELRTHSWRRSVCAGEFSYCINEDVPQAFVNGAVHWIGYNSKRVGGIFRNSIVSFDMKTESFGAMIVPDSIAQQRTLSVAVVDESLSLIHMKLESCSVWMMEEYGIVNSWTKKLEIKLRSFYGPCQRPLRFTRNGHVLMAARSGDLVSYDPESKKIRGLGINGGINGDQQSFYFYIDTYVESLVLLEDLDRVLERKGTSLLPNKRMKYSTYS
ncbi:hypothetical protein LguiA_022352 [Lonicera macranthoides]